jgi:prefoldin beta subunit
MKDNNISKDTQEKIMQLQMLQQRLQVFASQKQQFQLENIEVENALSESKKTKKPIYSLIGNIMIEKNSSDVKNELESKKKELDIKIKSLENQENKIKSNAEDIQKEVTKLLK